MQTTKKILYSCTDANNNLKNGYVDAESTTDALNKLTAAGFSNVELHNETTLAENRQDLVGLNEKELARMATLEIKARSGSSAFAVFVESCRNNVGVIVAGLLFTGFGFFSKDNVSIFVGVLLLLYVPVAVWWNRKEYRLYNNILVNFARGEWNKTRKLIKKMKKSMPHPSLAFDLDARNAYIEAINGNIDQAIKIISKWQIRLNNEKPGMYESRLSSIHYANKDYQRSLEYIREARTKCPESDIYTLDLALAEARFGSVENAKKLLNEINTQELPVYGIPFLNWTKGIVALKTGESDAINLLTAAQMNYSAQKNNPVVWPSMALCTGYLALSLQKNGRNNEAAALITPFMPILKVHADDMLLSEINNKFQLNRE